MPPDADTIIQRAIDRHGGAARWARLDRIDVAVEHLGGLVPWTKGLGRTFPRPSAGRIWPRRRRVQFVDYPAAGQRGLYDRGRVTLDDQLPETDHRTTFRGLGKLRRWSAADALYFFGYALTTYLSMPFALPQCEVLRVQQSGERTGLTVRLPADWHSHGPIQRFWFAPDGLLARHDYHAEIIGPGAYGAHFTADYVEREGLLFARRREVYLAIGAYPRVLRTPLPILQGRLEPTAVVDGHEEGVETAP